MMSYDNNNESSDYYGNVLFAVNNRHRVIRCKNDIQFILQRYSNRWRSVSFCVQPESLIRVLIEKKLVRPDYVLPQSITSPI